MAIALHASRPSRPAAMLFAVAVVVALGGLLISARPVGACSCVANQSMKAYATADNAVFTGTAGAREVRGVPVRVDRWFWGVGAAPVVWLAASSFGDSAACGTEPPPAGTAWLWVTWRVETGDFGTGACSPAGNLAGPDGQALLAEAKAVFNAIAPPEASPSSDGESLATQAPDPAAIARDTTGLAIGAVLIAASLALFGGLAVLARRSGPRANR